MTIRAVLPHNTEAEASLLAAILFDNEAYHRVSQIVLEEHFFDPAMGKIFASCARLIGAGRRPTPITLKHDVDSEALRTVLTADALPGGAVDMAKLVRDLAARRSCIKIAEELVERAFSDPVETTAEALIEGTESALAGLVARGTASKQMPLIEAITDAIDVIAAAYKRDNGLIGLSTGLASLNAKLGGLVPGELIILAGRPSMGKSALAANIAYNAAKQSTAVGFFTVEMSAQAIAIRLLGEHAEVSAHLMRKGAISAEQFDRVMEVGQELSCLPIYFDETGGITIAQLSARARRWKRKHNIGLLVVDYLQLMSGVKRRESGRVQEITEITTGLKALAKELEIPILALSQLSRAVESREDKRPQLSDLRESGSIEQDADVVMFVYREQYYLERTEPQENTEAYLNWKSKMELCANKAEVIIGKQRHGPTGTVELQFTPELTRFSDLAIEARLPYSREAA